MRRVRSNTEVAVSQQEAFFGLRADYDAGRPSIYRRARVGMQPGGTSADWHYRQFNAYYGMMELARELFRNNFVIGQGVRRMCANIVQEGFTLDVKTGDDGADDAIEARWKAFAENPEQCDITGEQTFHDLETLVLQNTVVDGDCFVLPTREGPIQLIEGHRCKTPTGTKKNVVHGVELDNRRRRLAYWITKEDLAPTAAVKLVGEVVQYAARDEKGQRAVLHMYRPDRMSQTRGVSAMSAVADIAGMTDDLNFATLVKAQSAACWTILRELPAGENIAEQMLGGRGAVRTETRPDGGTRRIEGLSPGMEVFSYPGEKLSGFSPNIPNSEFFQHAMLLLQILAINLDLPLAVLLLDPSKTNFSGWRGAIDQARLRFRSFQRWMVDHFHTPVYLWKIGHFLAEDAALRAVAKKRKVDIYGHRWNAPRWPYIEPMKDIAADVLEERTGQNSPRRVSAAKGRDFYAVADETIQDNAYRIQAAKKKAAEINAKYDDNQPVHWRELISMPTPEGITISMAADAKEPSEDSDQPPAKKESGTQE